MKDTGLIAAIALVEGMEFVPSPLFSRFIVATVRRVFESNSKGTWQQNEKEKRHLESIFICF